MGIKIEWLYLRELALWYLDQLRELSLSQFGNVYSHDILAVVPSKEKANLDSGFSYTIRNLFSVFYMSTNAVEKYIFLLLMWNL